MGEADTERIQRERAQRRAAERLRMEAERRERREELIRLREVDLEAQPLPPPPSDSRTRRFLVVAEPQTGPLPPDGELPPPSGGAETERTIGGSIRSTALEEFLATDPNQRFDLPTLNTLRLHGLVRGANADSKLIATIGRHAETLMARVKQEVDDPLSAGAFLRDQVLRWARESARDPEWGAHMPVRWAGIFSDSRNTGGRSQPWLNTRLWAVREEASHAEPFRRALRRSLLRDRPAESAAMRTPSEQIRGEVAQAILDDLAVHPYDPGHPRPLVRLSELAVRRQVPTVNEILAVLFSAPETGPFVILHPNRYPECDELQIRPPVAGATGAALAYTMVPGRPARKTGGRTPVGASTTGAAEPQPGAGDAVSEEEELDASTVWEAEVVGPATWERIVEERRKERRRLESPPKDCRTRPGYAPLRELVLEHPEFRKAFLTVKWRGRPSGLPLLASLLQKGALAPEVATDHEYLEAELGELVQGDAQWRPPDGIWTFGSWTVTREGSHREGFRFRADRAR